MEAVNLTFADMPAPTWFSPEIGPDWIASPCSHTPQSDALVESNFDAITAELDILDPNGATWGFAEFEHWSLGWVEFIFVKPGTDAHTTVTELRATIKKFGCLDEDLWLEYMTQAEKDKEK